MTMPKFEHVAEAYGSSCSWWWSDFGLSLPKGTLLFTGHQLQQAFEAGRASMMAEEMAEAPRCRSCAYRDSTGHCKSGKLADDWGQSDADKADMMLYDFNESGGFWVGENFGCVHHRKAVINPLVTPQ